MENPYLQYFIGLEEYQEEAVFDPNMMVYFRKRFNKEMLAEINEKVALKGIKEKEEKERKNKKYNNK